MLDNKRLDSYLEMKKKEKLNSLRDFKINSHTISPNTSALRADGNVVKKDKRDSYYGNNHSNSRKDLYRNHGHFKKEPGSNHNNYSTQECRSYNHSELRRNPSEKSDRQDKYRPSNSFTTQNKSTRPAHPVQSNAKAKIKQMLGGSEKANFSMQLENNIDSSYVNESTAKKANSKLIAGFEMSHQRNSSNGKKFHKKSNSMKSEIMNKYYIKGEFVQENSVDGGNIGGDIQAENVVRNVNTSHGERLSAGRDKNTSDMGFYQQNNSMNTHHVKSNSFMGVSGSQKTPANILNNCEARKNLNEKIMSKYKKVGNNSNIPQQNNQIKANQHSITTNINSGVNEYPKQEFPTTSALYEKFINKNARKSAGGMKDDSGVSGNVGKDSVKHSTSYPVKSFGEGPSWTSTLKNNLLNQHTPQNQANNKQASGHKRTESLNLKYSTGVKKNDESPTVYHAPNSSGGNQQHQNKVMSKNDSFSDRKGNTRKVRSGKASLSIKSENKANTMGSGFTTEVLENSYNNPSLQNNNTQKSFVKKSWKLIDEIKSKERELPHFEKAKVIIKEFGAVKAFSVNTHQGTVRNYNEDRVSIQLNAQQRFENLQNKGINQCSMFGIYDGHGGADCCNFQKENLHNYLLTKYKDKGIEEVIQTSFLDIDADFLKKAQKDFYVDTSGSCALVQLVVGNFFSYKKKIAN